MNLWHVGGLGVNALEAGTRPAENRRSTGERTSAEPTHRLLLKVRGDQVAVSEIIRELFLGIGHSLKVHHPTCSIITKYGLKVVPKHPARKHEFT